MTKQKSTKRALLASVLSLVLCISMLVGSTFAWFTDSATTGVNTIQSGNLDVVLEMWDGEKWVNAEGETLEFVKGAMGEDQEVLWEPGCTYELPMLRVVNNGNLALKYNIAITGINGDAKLNEVIEWDIDVISTVGVLGEVALDDPSLNAGWFNMADFYKTKDGGYRLYPAEQAAENDTDTYENSMKIAISGHMKEEAGNEYQGLTIDGISVTVYATQLAYEYDSNGYEYDETAPLPEINWAGGLTAETAGKHLAANGTYSVLTSAYIIDNNIVDNYAIYAGVTSSAAASQVTGNSTFNNCVFLANGSNSFWADGVKDGATITFNNCTFAAGIQLGGDDTNKYIFNNCTFAGKTNWSKALIVSYADVELNNCTFDYTAGARYSVRLADGMEISDVTVKGGTAIVQNYTYGNYVVSESGATRVADVVSASNAATYENGAYVVGGTATIPVSENYNRLNADGVTFIGVTFNDSKIATSGDVTFIDCTFNGNLDNSEPSDLVSFTGCTFNGNVHFTSGSGAEVAGSNFVATDCVFNKMVTLADFENATFTGCEFYGNNWAGKNVITYVTVGVNTFTDCTFTTGIRAAYGMTADDFVITNCNITIDGVSNLS